MPDLSKMYLFRMTHIENIPHILQYGITHAKSSHYNPSFVPIGDRSIISTRSNFVLNNGRPLGDYIPFYFAARTPMLYVIQNSYNLVNPTPAEKIVYCVSSVQQILDLMLDFVFTDGHAIDSFSTQYSVTDAAKIDEIIDINAIKAKYWKEENDLDLKRRKEAEFLVLGDIAPQAILGYIVYNLTAKEKMHSFGVPEEYVHIKSTFYF